MPVFATKFNFAWISLFALFEYGWGQDIANNSQVNGVRVSNTGSMFLTKIGYIRHRRESISEVTSFCLTPPQPANGEYELCLSTCDDTRRKVSVESLLKVDSKLRYRCNPGYRIKVTSDVICNDRGKWSSIPECVEVKCESLNSSSTMVSCTRFEKEIDCQSPVPPGTQARVTCRSGYKKNRESVTTRNGVFVTTRKEFVNCSADGKWEPQPIRCVPVCGVPITLNRYGIYLGLAAKIRDFPWHASLFVEPSSSSSRINKIFICGATIIRTNLLLTAAHCVYDERIRTTTDPAKLFVITGNAFRDYDSPLHDLTVVRKATVKNVYRYCNYYGLPGNYASDIALLELHQPLGFSRLLMPACLYDSEYSDQFLEPGIYGKIAGFGRTETSSTSGVLQTITVPYVSYSQCTASNIAFQNVAFISNDKFCAGYNNGSAVCEGDSGGGLMFEKDGLSYVMGIVSVGLGVDTRSGESICDIYSYTLYTKVSTYMAWIQDVLSYVERNQQYPSCTHDSQTLTVNSTPPIITPNGVTTSVTSSLRVNFCSAPQQPANGERKLHQKYCEDDNGMDCDILTGTKVKPGSQLVYRCASGFTTKGETDIQCLPSGEWTPFPTCAGDSCDLANGSLGVCTLLKDCQPLLEELEAGRPPNEHCGFSGHDPIVCCPLRSPMVPTTSRPPHTKNPVSNERGAIARQKCFEWSQYVNPTTCPTFVDDIKQPANVPGPSKRIEAGRMEFPHMAAVGFIQPDATRDGTINWDCAGTLISETFVMTIVSCIVHNELGDSRWVRVGDLNLERSDDGASPEDRRIAERIHHPNYKHPAKYNDIALLRLESRVPFNDWIRPACLHTAPTTEIQEVIAIGWGRLDWSDNNQSSDLMKVTLPLVNLQTCSAEWSSETNAESVPNGIDADLMICAGAEGRGSCKGDQGGPLVMHSMGKRCMYDVVGITSYGISCETEIPTIYTRVYHYVPWIESIVWK